MSSLSFYNDYFEKIYVHEKLEGRKDIKRCLSILTKADVKYVSDKDEIPGSDCSSRTIFMNVPKASIVTRCPGSFGHVCCNYMTIQLYLGCIIGCTYCIMKHYLNYSPLVVNVATERTIEEVAAIAKANQENTIRIGTGEVGDSLDLDPVFGLSAPLIEGFASLPNILFELKTKSESVAHLLRVKKKGSAVIGFSVNPESIIRSEEGASASLEARVNASLKAIESGYRVAFHFDPVFRFQGWEREYLDVVKRISAVPESLVAWISIGTFRYPGGLKDKIGDRWYIYDEFVECKDRKHRYLQKTRGEVYKYIVSGIRQFFPSVPVYMCMESSHMWNKVFGASPEELPELHCIFSEIPDIHMPRGAPDFSVYTD